MRHALVLMLCAVIGVQYRAQAQQDDNRVAPGKSAAVQPKRDASRAPDDATSGSPDYDNSLGPRLLKRMAKDQESIWISPARVRLDDTIWLVPLGGLTAAFLVTDRDASKHLSESSREIRYSKNLSNYGLGSLAAVGGGLYLWGRITRDDHKRETGLLAGEAALNSLAVTYAAKYMFGRERPLQDDFRGEFLQGGQSFPSEHSAAAWAIASVIAHEYPGPLTTFLAYGAASAIAVSRVTAEQHFPSDVLIGSAIGWFVGEVVYRHNHDPELGGGEWRTPSEAILNDHPYQPKNMGSPSVPLDSWIYPALDRLEAFGDVPEGFLGQRPWTRMECARLISEAADRVTENTSSSETADGILQALDDEFANELALLGGGSNLNIRMESAYTRVTAIGGEPLSDGSAYDFGQTIVNDYGRPYEQGANVIAGGSGWATAGPVVGYARVEYQYAPSAPALPLEERQVIQQVQGLPSAPPGFPVASAQQGDLLEGYAGIQFSNWEFSFGKQSLWWGPDQGGAMLFSNNAEPIEMFAINRVSPFTLPSILRVAGPIRVQFVLGRLNGQNWVFSANTGFTGSWDQPLSDQPFIEGAKISLKPIPSLEVGMGITTIFAGSGVPFTLHKLEQVLFPNGEGPPGTANDPGDRRGGFDFAYRLPRNWATLYGDAFTDDEISPWRRWDKAAVTSGLYIPRLPKVSKLDLRVEGMYTDGPALSPGFQRGFFYFNGRYVSGYTNDGNIIGSWVGREGQGAEAWTNYWFTPKTKLQFNFRHLKVSKNFIPFGGTLTDGGVRADVWTHADFSISGAVQYETWDFPVISARQRSDVATSVQISYWPKRGRLVRTSAAAHVGDSETN